MSISDPEVRLLASLAEGLRQEYEGDDDAAWRSSPFGWIKARPSRQVGTIGERLVAGWCATHDLNVSRSPDSDADRIVEGVRIEIKFSTIWKNGSYRFQQIRDQDYAILVCLGISPFDAHCWVFEKRDVMSGVGEKEGLSNQHGGRAGSDTAWLQVVPGSVPPWMVGFGGRLSPAMHRLRSLVGRAE